MAFLGGGGFRGALFEPDRPFFSASVRADRYATMVTNGGYDYPTRDAGYFQANFAYNPVKLADFTYLSEHRALPFGKELIRKFYGAAPSKSYFEGCSSGGHDAMMLSQRWPNDFGGIVARAPAGNFIGLHMQFNRIAKAVRNPAGMLNPSKQTLLAKAVLAHCDKLDGLEDGIISRPAACGYDPTELRCTDGADTSDSCLSDAQIATIKTITSPIATKDGAWSHPGYNFGAEDSAKGWGEYVWPSASFLGGDSAQGAFSDGFIRSFVSRDPSFDTRTWDANNWLASLSLVGALYQAFNPDLSALKARGAKLILWNGTNDTAISPRDTQRYHNRVVEEMGRDAADETVELFLAPGVGHCAGGAGPDQVDLLRRSRPGSRTARRRHGRTWSSPSRTNPGTRLLPGRCANFRRGRATRGRATSTRLRASTARWNEVDGAGCSGPRPQRPLLRSSLECWDKLSDYARHGLNERSWMTVACVSQRNRSHRFPSASPNATRDLTVFSKLLI